MTHILFAVLVLALLALAFGMLSASALEVHDLVYAAPDGREVKLDLDLPDEIKEPVPLVVMIHGGGWSGGGGRSGGGGASGRW